MIIDADVHISPTAQPGGSITVEELLRRMDRAGVDKALTWLHPPYLRHLDESNACVYEASRAHPDRIVPFGWADPNLGVATARETVRRCIEEYGFHGIKLNGAANGFSIDDPELSLPVVEEIAKTGKMAAFHVGVNAYETTHPFRLAKVARAFPRLKIFAVHMGGVGFPDMSPAVIEFAAECPNLYLIGSEIRSPAILCAVKQLGADRVCFGSDTPFESMHVELAKYRALLEDEIAPNELDKVLGGNVMRLLGLSPRHVSGG